MVSLTSQGAELRKAGASLHWWSQLLIGATFQLRLNYAICLRAKRAQFMASVLFRASRTELQVADYEVGTGASHKKANLCEA